MTDNEDIFALAAAQDRADALRAQLAAAQQEIAEMTAEWGRINDENSRWAAESHEAVSNLHDETERRQMAEVRVAELEKLAEARLGEYCQACDLLCCLEHVCPQPEPTGDGSGGLLRRALSALRAARSKG